MKDLGCFIIKTYQGYTCIVEFQRINCEKKIFINKKREK